VEKALKFEQFQFLLENVFKNRRPDGVPLAKTEEVVPGRLPALMLAYIGDAVFSLYVRTKLLAFEQQHVRIIHTYGAKMVSAKFQAMALKSLEPVLTEAEADIVRRGRNTKSTPTKNASVGEYRYSTGFEALFGYLFLDENYTRLSELADMAFAHISREMTNTDKDRGDQK
jgi:ribonuclease-3 family protein